MCAVDPTPLPPRPRTPRPRHPSRLASAAAVALVLLVAAAALLMPTPTPARAATAHPAWSGKAKFLAVAPAVVLDTVTGVGTKRAPLPAGRAASVAVAGRYGVPAKYAGAVELEVKASVPKPAGKAKKATAAALAVYGTGTKAPTAGRITLVPGAVTTTNLVVPLGKGGRVDVLPTGGTVVPVAAGEETDGRLSRDGSTAAYVTRAEGDGAGVYRRVLPEGRAQRVDVTPSESPAPGAAQVEALSADGGWVATGATRLVTRTPYGTPGNGYWDTSSNTGSFGPTLSPDGRWLGFASESTDLVTVGTRGYNVFRADLGA